MWRGLLWSKSGSAMCKVQRLSHITMSFTLQRCR
ncbi:Uncharacterised protein [Bordetella pertussis]|nr:Uncharacterised protein [Bordetella pertussis]CFW41903.1 Uncharacterised protein [Bordetella pertussis]CPL99202.1 Uncharacterised protein [Bordetella pertussis]CPM49644.1 Uncharacterised protein [Bordetella pertussis]CPO04033.1 Uncharacterised protein [Bordetella pertussis]